MRGPAASPAGPEAILTGRGGYRLAVAAEDVDAGRFERLVQRARELLALDHPDQAAYAADEALALWQGGALADLEDWEPGRAEAQRLTELRLQVEELRLDALLATARPDDVLPEATLRAREEPLREHRWALLSRAQYQAGRQAEALATLRRARAVLADELGLDPGAELVELEQAVLEQDPDLQVPAADLPAAGCPWPGLAPYDVDDAEHFFGRDQEVDECLERLARTGFLAVVGPSGSGKSSLARAGIAARLRHQQHTYASSPRPPDRWRPWRPGRRGAARARSWWSTSARRSSRPRCRSRSGPRSSWGWPSTPATERSCSPCAPTGSVSCPRTPIWPGWSRTRSTCSRASPRTDFAS